MNAPLPVSGPPNPTGEPLPDIEQLHAQLPEASLVVLSTPSPDSQPPEVTYNQRKISRRQVLVGGIATVLGVTGISKLGLGVGARPTLGAAESQEDPDLSGVGITPEQPLPTPQQIAERQAADASRKAVEQAKADAAADEAAKRAATTTQTSTTATPTTEAPATTPPTPPTTPDTAPATNPNVTSVSRIEALQPVENMRFGTMTIPSIGLAAGIYGFDGENDTTVLDRTNARFPAGSGKAEPVVGIDVHYPVAQTNDTDPNITTLFGHRTHATHPGRNIDKLKIGDEMTLDLTRLKEGTTDQYETYGQQKWTMKGFKILPAVTHADQYALYEALNPPADPASPSKGQLIFYACANKGGGVGNPNNPGDPNDPVDPYKANYRYITQWEQAE